jgi:hypothetical protein
MTQGLDQFDMKPYTQAPVVMRSSIRFRGRSCAQVFEALGDPTLIPEWYLLAKEVRVHEVPEGAEQSFDVVFAFFGEVHEEVLHWDPPHRYVYLAKGPEFPIRDYVAQIEVFDTGPDAGVMRWSVYCQDIEGAHNRKILPVMLPPINEASMHALAPLIGGVGVEVENLFT